jgi:hypothetical protein
MQCRIDITTSTSTLRVASPAGREATEPTGSVSIRFLPGENKKKKRSGHWPGCYMGTVQTAGATSRRGLFAPSSSEVGVHHRTLGRRGFGSHSHQPFVETEPAMITRERRACPRATRPPLEDHPPPPPRATRREHDDPDPRILVPAFAYLLPSLSMCLLKHFPLRVTLGNGQEKSERTIGDSANTNTSRCCRDRHCFTGY